MSDREQITKQAHPITLGVLLHLQKRDKKYIMLYGGTHSGKSYSTLEALFLFAASVKAGKQPEDKRILISGKDLARLWDGMSPMVEAVLSDMPAVQRACSLNIQSKRYTFITGWTIQFVANDSVVKVKNLGKCYAHFMDEIDGIPTTIWDFAADRARIMLGAWNPSADFEIEQVRRKDKERTVFYRSTLFDTYNAGLLDEEKFQELCRKARELGDAHQWTQVYFYGRKGVAEARVFRDVRRIDRMPQGAKYEYGADYGYSDPLTLCKVAEYEGAWYIECLVYQSGVDASNIATLFRSVMGEDAGRSLIICDNNPPSFSQSLRASGLRADPTTKGAGSIEYGVGLLAAKTIYIVGYTAASDKAYKEFTTYCRRERPEGGYYPDKFTAAFGDHAIDAARYHAMAQVGKAPVRISTKYVDYA